MYAPKNSMQYYSGTSKLANMEDNVRPPNQALKLTE